MWTSWGKWLIEPWCTAGTRKKTHRYSNRKIHRTVGNLANSEANGNNILGTALHIWVVLDKKAGHEESSDGHVLNRERLPVPSKSSGSIQCLLRPACLRWDIQVHKLQIQNDNIIVMPWFPTDSRNYVDHNLPHPAVHTHTLSELPPPYKRHHRHHHRFPRTNSLDVCRSSPKTQWRSQTVVYSSYPPKVRIE